MSEFAQSSNHEPLAQNARYRSLSHFADVACPVQPCVIRNLQLYPSSNECVSIWKSRLLLCLCESSRKDLQSKQRRRIPEQGRRLGLSELSIRSLDLPRI